MLLALKKAWLSYSKAELPLSGVLVLETVKEFAKQGPPQTVVAQAAPKAAAPAPSGHSGH